MREKKEHCVVTFATTAAAIAMEAACREEGIAGRLIPVPRTIRSGCGMCWAAPMEAQTALEELVVARHLMIDGIYAIII